MYAKSLSPMKCWVLILLMVVSISTLSQTHQVGNTTLTERDVVTGVNLPWELVWGQDDFIWCTLRSGKVLHIDPVTGVYTELLTKTVPYGGATEPGMLGLALHPDFPDTAKVYVVYNYNEGQNVKERISSFTYNGTALVDEVVLIDAIAGNGIHNGSRIIISPDRKIFMTTGDTGDGGVSSQNLSSLNGKVLRMNLDGSIPTDNPWPNSYVYSYGHRNGQGLCWGPNGSLIESEHGQNNSDELNKILPGKNYGWPQVEGACNTTTEVNYCALNPIEEPLLEWSPCRAVCGLEYYTHPAIPEWQNSILMAVLGGLNSQYERLSVIHFTANGDSAYCVDSVDTYFQSFNQRIRDICVNPHNGAVFLAFNGVNYPGYGPNVIKEFRNLEYIDAVNEKPKALALDLFPNPVHRSFQLRIGTEFLGGNYEIMAFNGQKVSEGKLYQSTTTIDAAEWSVGKYFIRVVNNNLAITKTFVVE